MRAWGIVGMTLLSVGVFTACGNDDGQQRNGSETSAGGQVAATKPRTLAEYSAKATEINSSYRGCKSVGVDAYETCVDATNEVILLAGEIEQIVRTLPPSEAVANALIFTNEISTAGSEWTSKNCSSFVGDTKAFYEASCSPRKIVMYFDGLTKALAELTKPG